MTLGSAGFQLGFPGAIGWTLHQYTRVTGSGFGYSFFSPGVFDQLVARFEVIDQLGKSREVPFSSGVSNEADIRFISVIDQFWMPDGAKPKRSMELKRSLSASLARIFFRRYSDAKEVVVHLEEYQFVTLPEFNAGARPKTQPVYQAKFSLHPIQNKL
ncbi:MAG: hypothetical protein ACXVBE_12360 [Bdellovibrionota bacterium]